MAVSMILVDSSIESALRRAGLGDYRRIIACDAGKVAGRSGTSVTRLISLPTDDGELPCFLKVYRYARRSLVGRLGPDHAVREARNYATLRCIPGVNVPVVLAFGTRRRVGLSVDGFILTRAVDDAVSLDGWAMSRWGRRIPRDDSVRAAFLAETAALVRRMHEAGFYHVDLQWRNLLAQDDGGDVPRLYVIDCVRGGQRRSTLRRAHGQLRDLSSFYKDAARFLSRTDLLRWFRAYVARPPSAGSDAADQRRLTANHRAMIRTILYDRALKDGPRFGSVGGGALDHDDPV